MFRRRRRGRESTMIIRPPGIVARALMESPGKTMILKIFIMTWVESGLLITYWSKRRRRKARSQILSVWCRVVDDVMS